MRKIIASALFMFALVSLFMSAAHAESLLHTIKKNGKLRVGLDAGYMPFEMTDKKGQVVGFDVDIAQAIADSMGVKLELVNTDFDGMVPALLADKFDIIISGMTITQERNMQIMFSDSYIEVGQAVLLHPKHKDTIKSYKDLNDPKYTVVSRLGTTVEQAVKKHLSKATYKSFDKETDGGMEIVNGGGDAFVYDLPFCVVFKAQQGKDLIFLDQPFTYEPLGIGFRQGDPDFMNWINNFLRQYKADGRYEQIYNKWMKSTGWIQNIK